MMDRILSSTLRRSQEFQSGMVRLLVWALMLVLLGLAGLYGVYEFEWGLFAALFAAHLLWYLTIQMHVIYRPELIRGRTYLGVVADMSGTSLCIYLSGNPISPFALLYVLSYLSQGTRFGRNNLIVTSIASVVAFTVVSTVLDGWNQSPIELVFMLLFMITLPLYQYALLKKLRAAKQVAEAANLARGDFLATMTHELRTPLSGMIGMAGLLSSTKLDDEQREYLESVNASANVLQSLIGDILDLSKIDAGKLELKSVFFDIRKVSAEVSSALSNQALDKNVDVICRVAPDVPDQVYGDELRFRQILFNLTGNAIKFTEEGEVCTHVYLGSPDKWLDRWHLVVSVRDTDIGIDQQKLSAIFESFWQASASTNRRYGGTGLGTSIARDLTRLMGGVIGVESEKGKGSNFWIKVPLLDPEALQAPEAPTVLAGCQALVLESNKVAAMALEDACQAAQMQCQLVTGIEHLNELGEPNEKVDVVLISDSPSGMDLKGLAVIVRNLLGRQVPVVYLHYPPRKVQALESNESSVIKPFSMCALWEGMAAVIEPRAAGALHQAAVADMPDEPQKQQAHVLVAEDDAINGKLIRSLLDKMGYLVTLVRDGEAALREALTGSYDLALVDLRMPKMHGIDFARAYRRQEPDGERLPIIALTANAIEDARTDCIAAGMDEFLTKPVDPKVLSELLKSYHGET